MISFDKHVILCFASVVAIVTLTSVFAGQPITKTLTIFLIMSIAATVILAILHLIRERDTTAPKQQTPKPKVKK